MIKFLGKEIQTHDLPDLETRPQKFTKEKSSQEKSSHDRSGQIKPADEPKDTRDKSPASKSQENDKQTRPQKQKGAPVFGMTDHVPAFLLRDESKDTKKT